MSAANGPILKPGAPVATISTEATAARELGALAAWNNKREGAAGAVMCAMAFEVLGQATGVLARGGWQRARGIFVHCLVRCPPLLHPGKMRSCIATVPTLTAAVLRASGSLAYLASHAPDHSL
jgi:hypothetical protein